MKAQRQVWGETLAELAGTDHRLVVLDADLATSTRADIVADAHPDSFIQVGIAEQNMVGMAFGLSTLGYRPWVSSFGVFLTNRALDQVRMLVSQTKAPVRLAAAYSGLLNGASGKTHQDIEDFAIMRAMPNMTVLAPADEIEAAHAIRWAADHDGPLYIRLARDPVPPVFDQNYTFMPGKPVLLRNSDNGLVIISTGVQTARTTAALDLLHADGIHLRHLHLHTLKPANADAIIAHLAGASAVCTVEEHTIIGGLGELVSDLVTRDGLGARVTRIGLDDRWSESGPNDFLLDKHGLSPHRVADRLRRLLPAA
ncbi:MAG TPA: transketolase C-terminal domain-containing protein [Streptosporangiaceae bacterium]